MLGWARRIQQRWMCSLAYRSGVEPPLPRLKGQLVRSAPCASELLRAGLFCSRLNAIRARCVLLMVLEVVRLVSLVLRCCYVLGVSHTCPPIHPRAAATFRFGLGPRLCRHHRALHGPYSDVLAPVHGVAEIPEGFEINNNTTASLWLPPRSGASK